VPSERLTAFSPAGTGLLASMGDSITGVSSSPR